MYEAKSIVFCFYCFVTLFSLFFCINEIVNKNLGNDVVGCLLLKDSTKNKFMLVQQL